MEVSRESPFTALTAGVGACSPKVPARHEAAQGQHVPWQERTILESLHNEYHHRNNPCRMAVYMHAAAACCIFSAQKCRYLLDELAKQLMEEEKAMTSGLGSYDVHMTISINSGSFFVCVCGNKSPTVCTLI